MRVYYTSESFPSTFAFPKSGWMTINWDDILWAALTIGRPSTYHILRHGRSSFHEAIFRLSLVRMALSEGGYKDDLVRTGAFEALDPTEKGMVSYFLGMTFTKLFAALLLRTPWLLHLDVFKAGLNPTTLGRSRPDLIGQSASGDWYAFESKGRSGPPSHNDRLKAKAQAARLVAIGGIPTTLHVGSFSFFRSGTLEFYWRDPVPGSEKPMHVPEPGAEWQYYYEYALSLVSAPEFDAQAMERQRADLEVEIHPKIYEQLVERRFADAYAVARQMREELEKEGYKPDGLRVIAGNLWRENRVES